MTGQERVTLLAIERHFSEHGTSPSYRELQAAVGIKSVSHIARIIENLVRNGFIRRPRGRRRGIEIIRPVTNLCPCCGRYMGDATT